MFWVSQHGALKKCQLQADDVMPPPCIIPPRVFTFEGVNRLVPDPINTPQHSLTQVEVGVVACRSILRC
jgi:hypothetical protein